MIEYVKRLKMIKKFFSNIFIFLIVFAILSAIADVYYYSEVVQDTGSGVGEISYSDFKVMWQGGYDLHKYILKEEKTKGYMLFHQFWFLSPSLRQNVKPTAKPGEYIVYKRGDGFYQFRYSPFAAFLMMPFGKILHKNISLAIWYILLNFFYLAALLLIVKTLTNKKNAISFHGYLILWVTFLASLRFYFMNIDLGQTDVLVAFLLALFLLAHVKNRPVLCGILLAFILQFKLFFAPVLLYFLITKRIKIVVSALLAFAVFLFIPSYMIGISKNVALIKDWLRILSSSIPSQLLIDKNQSITYALSVLLLKIGTVSNVIRNFSIDPKYLFYAIGGGLTILSYSFMAKMKGVYDKNKKGNERLFKAFEVSMLVIITLLFSPIAWQAHFMPIIIPLGFSIYLLLKQNKKTVPVLMLLCFFLLSSILGTDLTKFIPLLNQLHFVNIATGVIFLALGIIYAYTQHPLTHSST